MFKHEGKRNRRIDEQEEEEEEEEEEILFCHTNKHNQKSL